MWNSGNVRNAFTLLAAMDKTNFFDKYGQNQLVVGSELTNMNSANEFQLAIDF